jgi:hypothetical protein
MSRIVYFSVPQADPDYDTVGFGIESSSFNQAIKVQDTSSLEVNLQSSISVCSLVRVVIKFGFSQGTWS